MLRAMLFAAVAIFAISPFSVSQDFSKEPALPADLSAFPLIVWSELQKPRPIPEKAALPDQQTSARFIENLTGTVVNERGDYLLISPNDVALPLDDQQNLKRFEGTQVRISGCADSVRNVVHITSIQPLF